MLDSVLDVSGERSSGKRVLIVDDHPVFRRGLVGLLATESWVASVLEAGTLEDAVREAVTGHPDVVAMDLRLPDGDGLEATRRILRARPTAKILVLTMTDDGARAREAIRAGARGYALKRSEPEDIVRALHTVARGGYVLDPDVGRDVLGHVTERPDVPPDLVRNLSPRQVQILTMIGEGRSNSAIARELGVAEKTVRNVVGPILTEIGARDRVDAALKARGRRPVRRPSELRRRGSCRWLAHNSILDT